MELVCAAIVYARHCLKLYLDCFARNSMQSCNPGNVYLWFGSHITFLSVVLCFLQLPLGFQHNSSVYSILTQHLWKLHIGSSVSKVTEGISTFSFCFALNELYFAVWVSLVVQSNSPEVQSSDCTHLLYTHTSSPEHMWLHFYPLQNWPWAGVI